MITARLRRLERAQPCLRAEILVRPIAEAYADQCILSIERDQPYPDVIDFLRTYPKKPRPRLIHLGPVLSYAERCAKNRSIPDPFHFTHYYVHGHALIHRLYHPNPKYRCRCGTLLEIPPGAS